MVYRDGLFVARNYVEVTRGTCAYSMEREACMRSEDSDRRQRTAFRGQQSVVS